MKLLILSLAFFMAATGISQENIYDFTFNSIDGVTHSFQEFKGRKIIIVNTASECGFTPQYQELQELFEKYNNDVVIIGFPANNFGGQEPGTNEEIQSFCQVNYGVTFLMAEKTSVKGSDISPLFEWLCAQENESFDGAIRWNFEKFLIDENGTLVGRRRSGVNPMDEEIITFIGK